jgi:predicted O-methyltransferase YrrM
MHNKVNIQLGKREITFEEFIESMQNLSGEVLRITGLNKKVNVYPEYARNFLPTLKRAVLDIAFVDLNTDSRYLLEELVLLWRKVKTGGIIVINDYKMPSKVKPIFSFLECYDKKYEVVKELDNQLILIKTEQEAPNTDLE